MDYKAEKAVDTARAVLDAVEKMADALEFYADASNWFWSEQEQMWCLNCSDSAKFTGKDTQEATKLADDAIRALDEARK